jgi:site-specific DNA-cytosine methylase
MAGYGTPGARLQSFPDDFIFYYDKLNDGYKMVAGV